MGDQEILPMKTFLLTFTCMFALAVASPSDDVVPESAEVSEFVDDIVEEGQGHLAGQVEAPCGKNKDAMVYKLTISNDILKQGVAGAAKQILDEMLWSEIANEPGAEKTLSEVSKPTTIRFLDTHCNGGVLKQHNFLMRARDSADGKDFTFKWRGDSKAAIQGKCMELSPTQNAVPIKQNNLKSKRQVTAADGGTYKTAYALYDGFKNRGPNNVGTEMFNFATQQGGHSVKKWKEVFPVLQKNLHDTTQDSAKVKVIRATVQKEVGLGGKARVGGVEVGFAVITWESEGELIGGELTWGFNCKKAEKKGKKGKGKKGVAMLLEEHGFESTGCARAAEANLKLFEALLKLKKFIGSGSKPAALMTQGKCPTKTRRV